MGIIRLLLAIAVILAHTGPLPIVGRLTNGTIAVQGFFILSGFYMALVLQEKYDRPSDFYWNRASRIYSGYWVAMAVTVTIALFAHVNRFSDIAEANWGIASKLLMVVSNIFIVGSDAMMFFYPGPSGLTFTPNFMDHTPLYLSHYIPAAWSLPVELVFYLIAPFVVRSVRRLLAVAAISILVRLLTYFYFGEIDPWTYRFVLSEMAFFMFGALSYHSMLWLRSLEPPKILGDIALAVVVFSIFFYEYIFRGSLWPFYAMFVVAVPLIFLRTEDRFSISDRYAGELAYMVYLTHVIFLQYLKPLTTVVPKPSIVIVLTLLLSVPLHTLAHRLDLKARRWWQKSRVTNTLSAAVK